MAKLGDFFTIASGGTPDKRNPSYYENGTIPWVKTGDLKNQYVPAGIECITEEGLNNSSAKLFPPNTVLVAMYGATIGACSILTYEAATNQACAAFLPNKNVLPTYLYYFLSSKREQFVKDGVGGAQPNISAGYLKNVQFGLIPMQQQIDIVEKLDKVEKLIVLRKEQLAKLDQLVKSRFIELFVDKDFPKTTIGELVASKVSSVKKVFLPTDTIKYIDISSIDNKRNIMTGFTEYVLEDAPSRAQQHIRKGDIVVSTVRPNLKNVAITGYDYDNLVASSGFCVLRAEKCLPSYLMAVVCSDDFTDAMTKVVIGANYPAIKDSDVKNYVVPNPPVELQEQFAAFVEQTDKSKLAIQQSLDKLELLKKSLMQKYFG